MIHPRADRTPLVEPGQIEHHVADLSATFAADVTLASAQAKLHEHNQWLPIDGDPNATLGELVERNSTGPLRLGFGAWRDLMLGAQFRNGDGALVTAGGRTVKNVAGYDLTKFMVGQYGIFGKVVTITTRTYKRVELRVLAQFDPDIRKLNALLVTPCRPHWALITKDTLFCGYLGDAPAAEFYEKNLPQYQPRALFSQMLDDDMTMRAIFWRAKAQNGLTFRAALPPSKIVEFVKSTGVSGWIADAAFGVVIGSCAPEAQDALQKAASIAGGSVVIFDSTGRPQNLPLEPGIASLLRRLKLSFDSHGNLNPLPLAAS